MKEICLWLPIQFFLMFVMAGIDIPVTATAENWESTTVLQTDGQFDE